MLIHFRQFRICLKSFGFNGCMELNFSICQNAIQPNVCDVCVSSFCVIHVWILPNIIVTANNCIITFGKNLFKRWMYKTHTPTQKQKETWFDWRNRISQWDDTMTTWYIACLLWILLRWRAATEMQNFGAMIEAYSSSWFFGEWISGNTHSSLPSHSNRCASQFRFFIIL